MLYILQKFGDFFHIAYLQKFYTEAFFVQNNPILTYTNNLPSMAYNE